MLPPVVCDRMQYFPSREHVRHHDLWSQRRTDGQTDDAAAIQRAINACSAAGGGTVIIPAGHTFLCGPLYLKSYVNLHLEPNSRLLANPDESIYTESAFRENRGEGMMWISGKDLKQISITGTGEIDGNGIAFMGKELDDSYELKPVTDFDPRPHVLTLINAEKTVIRDITIRNSAYWTIHLIGCYDALIDGISLLNKSQKYATATVLMWITPKSTYSELLH